MLLHGTCRRGYLAILTVDRKKEIESVFPNIVVIETKVWAKQFYISARYFFF